MMSSLNPLKVNRISSFSTLNPWNSQIREAVSQNNAQKAISLFRKLKLKGLQPNNLTFPFIAKACAKLSNLKCSQLIHCHIEKSPFRPDIYVQTAIVDMYVKCNRLDEALKVFDRMPDRDVASWNVIILGFAQMGFTEKVLGIFREMRFGGIQPDSVTLMGLTEGMLQTKNLSLMKAIHSFGIRVGIDGDVSVANTWVAGYAKCGDLGLAELVFDGIEEGLRTVVSWNSMIAGYANFEKFFDGFTFYKRMLIDGLRPEVSTIVSLLSSCVQTGAPSHGRLIHCHGILSGCDLDVCFNNTLISMYSKCGDTDSARFVFDGMSERTCVSWTVMIRGYANKGDMDEALALFYAMKIAGEKPDLVTVQSLISGCGQAGLLELGKWMDNYATCNGLKDNLMLCNSLIDMYAKCGSMGDAQGLFYSMPEKTVVSWTTMIAGCALNGDFGEALDLFNLMLKLGLEPNHITYIAVLQACTHAGFLEKGLEYFSMMTKVHNIAPGLDHYSCMADLLGRKGKLKEALDLVQHMPIKPDAGIWGTLLGACKIHHNVEIGEYVAHHLFKLEPRCAAPYVEMANIYASAGRWDGVARTRRMMKGNNAKKFPGQSVVQVKGKTHTFTVEDRGHPEGILIYTALDSLNLQSIEEVRPL